jgi:hypothetical protein
MLAVTSMRLNTRDILRMSATKSLLIIDRYNELADKWMAMG